MKRTSLLLVLLMTIGFAAVSSHGAVNAFDISGKWVFSVDLDDGGHGDPTFVFKQDQNKLTGSYDGPLGKYDVTGSIKDKNATFGFEFTNDGEKHKVSYEAVVESATKMSGTMEISGGPKGKWTATKK